MKPSLKMRARMSMTPQMRAIRLVYASHVVLPGVAPGIAAVVSPAARMAAVAESAPTTSSRDEPSSTNSSVGKMTV